jgi:hypothetical protein
MPGAPMGLRVLFALLFLVSVTARADSPAPPASAAKPANPLADAVAQLKVDVESHCKKDELRPFYKKTACSPNDISSDQLGDASKATAEEKAAIQKVRIEVAGFDRRLAQALRQYGGPNGDSLAAVVERIDGQLGEAIMNLFFQKISWGEYNGRRKELQNEFRDQVNEIRAAK